MPGGPPRHTKRGRATAILQLKIRREYDSERARHTIDLEFAKETAPVSMRAMYGNTHGLGDCRVSRIIECVTEKLSLTARETKRVDEYVPIAITKQIG